MFRSIKTAIPAVFIVIMLSAAPSYAAGRQSRDQDAVRSPIQRVVQIVQRLLSAAPHGTTMVPHP